jgi:hypothetical protein
MAVILGANGQHGAPSLRAIDIDPRGPIPGASTSAA